MVKKEILGKYHGAKTLGNPYDYGSVMHYGRTAFSKNGRDTITPKNGASIGQRNGASNQDIIDMRLMYQCTSGARTLSEYNANRCTSDCKCWEGQTGCNGNNDACQGSMVCSNNRCSAATIDAKFIKSIQWNTFLRFNSNRDVDFTTNQREWERVTLEKVDGDKYAIKSAYHSNMYLRVGGPGEGNVVNTQTYIGAYEKFYIEKLDGGRVAFKSARWGNYLRVHSNGHLDTQTYIGSWEQFAIIGGDGGDGNVLTKFQFYPMMDSHGNDIKWSNAGGIEAYAKECMMRTDCQGFNSNGWLKRTVRPQSEWNKWTSDKTKGFYVKK